MSTHVERIIELTRLRDAIFDAFIAAENSKVSFDLLDEYYAISRKLNELIVDVRIGAMCPYPRAIFGDGYYNPGPTAFGGGYGYKEEHHVAP